MKPAVLSAFLKTVTSSCSRSACGVARSIKGILPFPVTASLLGWTCDWTYDRGMSQARRRWLRFLGLAVLLVVVIGVVMRRPVLSAVGRALVVDEPIEHADVIVVPQWAGESGAIDAADLFRDGIAPRVVVLSEPSQPAAGELARPGISYMYETDKLVQLI